MLTIKSLTLKNFLSIGNITQAVSFTNSELVLVLGENLDQGGSGNKNGVGKTALINGLSYALFGKPLVNVKLDNLTNKTNNKGMYVTLTFDVNGVDYKIERGRKPGIFKFFKNGIIRADEIGAGDNEAQGENKNTQIEIESIIGISHEMFKHVVALNTYTEPFLSLRANDQRIIIEQLLGITKLSEKAEKLKEEARITKDDIKSEEFKITADTEANKRIQQNITNIELKSAEWEKAKERKLESYQSALMSKLEVDIDAEITLHKAKKDADELSSEFRTLSKELSAADRGIADTTRSLSRLEKEIANSIEKICPVCHQEMDKETHENVHNGYVTEQQELVKKLADFTAKKEEVKQLADVVSSMLPVLPNTYYKTIDEAYNHKTTLDTLGNSLTQELESINPFTDQITSLQQHGLQEIDFTKLNELSKLKDHHDLLLKLLSSKDSFIRKKIIEQNLSFLNHRLSHYLTDIGLPHKVIFKSDLEVEITVFGKEFDFDNLSRGERTRLILSLSWAFRDVFENMTNKINLLFVDELIDSGLDSAGVEAALAILKKMAREQGRSVYLISHRDELVSRVSNIMKVIKSGGFTTIENTTSVVANS